LTAEEIPPWEAEGLPSGIQEQDIVDAAAFLRSGALPTSSRLISAYGPLGWGWYCRLYGTHYEHNIDRLHTLLEHPPVHTGKWGRRLRKTELTYPALLIPDPSPLEADSIARPVAACSGTGYLGSAWDEPATALRPQVDAARAQGTYLVTALRVQEDTDASPVEWHLAVWLPRAGTFKRRLTSTKPRDPLDAN
jgi:hypothetical protein